MQKIRFLAPLLALVGALALTIPALAQPPQTFPTDATPPPSPTPSDSELEGSGSVILSKSSSSFVSSSLLGDPAPPDIILESPFGDPTEPYGAPTSEFVYSGASDVGVLAIPCEARINPDTAENRAAFVNRIRFKISAIGDSHTQSQTVLVRWDNPWFNYTNGASRDGKGVYDSNTGTFKATAYFIGLPRQNADFGLKTVTVQLTDTDRETVLSSDLTQIEVFYNALTNNHPGDALNAVPADFGTRANGTGARCPNIFYYFLQAIGDNYNNEVSVGERYAEGLLPRVFNAATPGLFYYDVDYSGNYS